MRGAALCRSVPLSLRPPVRLSIPSDALVHLYCPPVDPTRETPDPPIPRRLQDLACLERPHPVVTDRHDLPPRIDFGETAGELTKGDVHRVLDPGDLPLPLFAHVHQQRTTCAAAPLRHCARLHLRLHRCRLDAAELLVVDQLAHGRVLAADRAVGILLEADLPEAHRESIEQEEASTERFSVAQDQLDRLQGLEAPDDAGEGTDDAALRT